MLTINDPISPQREYIMNSFRMDIAWCCPNCDKFNLDKQDTNEGVVNELQCHNCFVTFNLETQEQTGGMDEH